MQCDKCGAEMVRHIWNRWQYLKMGKVWFVCPRCRSSKYINPDKTPKEDTKVA